MTTQTEALKLALEALDQLTNAADTFSVSGVYFNEGVWAKKCLSDAYFAITAIEQALAQPEQDKERCVGCEACIDTACGRDECPKGWPKAAQPEQEPVEWGVDWGHDGNSVSIIKRLAGGGIEVVGWEYAPHPPKRTWVGLTPDDFRQLEKETTVNGYNGDYCPTWDLIEAVEEKLKEKNTK